MYQDKLWKETEELLVKFFQEEQGNRFTINNWNSFIGRIKAIFNINKEAADEPKIRNTKDPGG